MLVRAVIQRAINAPGSRHVIFRFRFNHAKTSVWSDTIPKVLSLCFPSLRVKTFDEIAIRSATGSRDPKIYYEWAPLYSQTEKERAEVFKLNAEAARAIVGTGAGQELITREAVSKALISRIEKDGNLPGLAAAVDAFGSIDENEPSEEESLAAAQGFSSRPENSFGS
nr:hypothetical protein [Agrobacterium sp. 10MFCol1.1]